MRFNLLAKTLLLGITLVKYNVSAQDYAEKSNTSINAISPIKKTRPVMEDGDQNHLTDFNNGNTSNPGNVEDFLVMTDNPTLRTIAPISEKEYERFETLKRTFKTYSFFEKGDELLSSIDEARLEIKETPIFDVIHPDTHNRFIILGTQHDLPLELFSPWLNDFIETTTDEVYVESEFFTIIRSMLTPSKELALSPKAVALLQPLLDVFSGPEVSHISLSGIFNIVMCMDAMLGMDATISMLTLKLGKKLYLLDAESDFFDMNLKLLKMQNEEDKKALHDTDDKLVKAYIDENVPYLYEQYVKQKNTSYSDLTGYTEDRKNALDPEYLQQQLNDPEFKQMNTELRNERWMKLLLSTTPEKLKLVCVGAAHLPDLFSRFQKEGFVITAKTSQ